MEYINLEDLLGCTREVRTKYAFIFKAISEYYNLLYQERPSADFKEVVPTTEKLFENKYISEYLFENLKHLYELYPTMLPGVVMKSYKADLDKEKKRQEEINKLLDIVIKDLNDTISDKAEEIAERMILDLDGFDD